MSLLAGIILRVFAVVGLCLAGASAWTMVEANQAIRSEVAATADRVEKEALSLAWRELMFRGNEGSHARFAFPEWRSADTLRIVGPGYCVSLAWTGDAPLKICGGRPDGVIGAAPAWFVALNSATFGAIAPATREIAVGRHAVGSIVAEADPTAAAFRAWRQTSVVLGVAGAMAIAIALLAALAIGHALKPAETIVRGLRRLEDGDHAVRLPDFTAKEFAHVARAFNALTERLARTTEQRAAMTRRLIEVQEDERRSLARDLHDEFAQCLTATRALAAAVEVTTRERPDVAESAREIGVISDRMAGTLRSTLARLRPPELDDLGLEQSLDHLIARANARMAGLATGGASTPVFRLEIVGSLSPAPADAALAVYRITQECITNAAKHGSPTEVRVRVERTVSPTDKVTLVVEDDGGGDPATLSFGEGHGLIGIRERVDALGGRFSAGPAPRGVRIEAVIPLSTVVPALEAAE